MALRQIRIYGDEMLTKVCRPVTSMTQHTKTLIHDMLDTMYDANGVGLAAPQVGVLRRIAVVDIGEGPLVLVNPEILESSGEQTGQEGCLSLPGEAGDVTRPSHIKVRAQDEDMNEFTMEAEELLARAICHECDHLDGIMYVEKVIGDLYEVTDEEESGEGEEEKKEPEHEEVKAEKPEEQNEEKTEEPEKPEERNEEKTEGSEEEKEER